ncbi:beta-lactamase-like protein [Aspergillus heterothallicus]
MATKNTLRGVLCHRKPSRLFQHRTVAFSSYIRAFVSRPLHQLSPAKTPVSHPCTPSFRIAPSLSPYTTVRDNTTQTQAAAENQPEVHSIFEHTTSTWQHIVADKSTSTAAIIDPVLDYDSGTREVSTASADLLLALVKKQAYSVTMILETHAHADHLTAAAYLQARLAQQQGFRPSIGIGARIDQVQHIFGRKYGICAKRYHNVFDRLFDDNETFTIGSLRAIAMHLPGHTPDHMGYKIGDHVFCGDSIFHPDLGTARCDFPGGSAKKLFQSGRRLLELPDHVKLWVGHDYPSADRPAPVPCITVGEHRRQNKHLKFEVTEAEFVKMRTDRDAGLAAPRLLDPALQINIRAGRMPKPAVVHLPLKFSGARW